MSWVKVGVLSVVTKSSSQSQELYIFLKNLLRTQDNTVLYNQIVLEHPRVLTLLMILRHTDHVLFFHG